MRCRRGRATNRKLRSPAWRAPTESVGDSGAGSGDEGAEGAARAGGGAEDLGRLDEVALHEVDAVLAQPVEVLLLLDLLGDDPELERARELDHRGNHFLVDLVGHEVVR